MNTPNNNLSKPSNMLNKNEENIQIDLSPLDEDKVFSQAVLVNFTQKIKDFQSNIQNKSKNIDTPYKRWGHSSLEYNNSLIIFGGRHSTRSLVNIYSFDLENFFWYKLDPLGQTPSARDSHSAIILKNELICFGGSGSGKKLNDLWSFNLENKKWSKINSSGTIPSAREGQNSAIIKNNYLMIYGGLDQDDNNLFDIFLLDLRCFIWYKVDIDGTPPETRDSQSCSMINNSCYIFGGQGNDDVLFNDMFILNFEINETQKTFKATWEKEEVEGVLPSPRTSHTSTAYKENYVIIIGGEGYNEKKEKIPLKDIWFYNVLLKNWSEIKVSNSEVFEPRFCHSATLIGNRIFIYGGMKNAETTLDSLVVLCLNGNKEGLEEDDCIEMKNNVLKRPKTEDDLLLLTNDISISNVNQEIINKNLKKDVSTDTRELIFENEFDFEVLKKNYLNNLVSWTFLKKLSDFNQWPLGCLGNIIENSLKPEVDSQNIFVDARAYNKYVYTDIEKNYPEEITEDFLKEKYSKYEGISLQAINDFSHKIIVLSIKDDGKGIPSDEFNRIFYSFSTNDNKEYNFFKYGISLKTSAIRLSNSFFIISKTSNEVNIGLMSKNMQNKLESDFIFTPIVNYYYEKNLTYIAKSNLSQQSLNFILNEIKFLFFDQDEIFNYISNMKTGTHIFLYDLRQISANKDDVNQLKNFELFFDLNDNDIYYNFFDIQVGERSYIDCSFVNYLKYFFLDFKSNCNFYLFSSKIKLCNPLKKMFDFIKESNYSQINKIKHNLKFDGNATKGFLIDNEIYKGILLNEDIIKLIHEDYRNWNLNKDNDADHVLDQINLLFNGILLYSNNRLISRTNQNKFGDITYFVKKYENFYRKQNVRKKKFLFPICGFLELPTSTYGLLYNKTVLLIFLTFLIFLFFYCFKFIIF